jgi:predicted ABC-type exoprotein transport system permease subunit
VLLSAVSILWVVVTVALVAVMIWKSVAGMKEEDTLFLTEGEAKEAAEQQKIIAQMERLAYWAKVLGIASLVLLLLAGGIWIYHAFVAFNNPQGL